MGLHDYLRILLLLCVFLARKSNLDFLACFITFLFLRSSYLKKVESLKSLIVQLFYSIHLISEADGFAARKRAAHYICNLV